MIRLGRLHTGARPDTLAASVNIELINTGSELMLGRVLNSHQQWICRQLADRGYVVTRQVAVPDTGEDIQRATREALARADLIIVTGGLGPTSDDITREKIAGLLGVKLVRDTTALATLERFYANRNRAVPERALVQAFAPKGAIVLDNQNGTAPGLAMEVPAKRFRRGASAKSRAWLIMLPGPPRELRPMFLDQVVPFVQREFPQKHGFVCRTLRSTGVPESLMEQIVAPVLAPLVAKGLELGYCARNGEVDVRLAARGPTAKRLVAGAEKAVRSRVDAFLFGEEDALLEEVVVRLLTEQKKTLALAESCTGGFIAHRLTNISGASAVLLAGLVTYSNDAKQKFLGVRASTLAKHGAVSEAVVREMAEGVRARTGADLAVAVTGIAGPMGGSAEKPVGTAFLAIAGGGPTRVMKVFNPFDRETFKYVTAQQALELVRRQSLGVEDVKLPVVR
jgi:nicotinamide-nucleotide amidase